MLWSPVLRPRSLPRKPQSLGSVAAAHFAPESLSRQERLGLWRGHSERPERALPGESWLPVYGFSSFSPKWAPYSERCLFFFFLNPRQELCPSPDKTRASFSAHATSSYPKQSHPHPQAKRPLAQSTRAPLPMPPGPTTLPSQLTENSESSGLPTSGLPAQTDRPSRARPYCWAQGGPHHRDPRGKKRDPPSRHNPSSAPRRAGGGFSAFLAELPAPPRGEGLRPRGVARGPEAPPRGWPSRKRGARRAGARCGAPGGGVCAGLGGQPRRTAAAGARGAGRKSLFTQTAHRLGNNAVKEVSRLGLTAPTSCSHTHQRKKKKKKRSERKKKKGGKNQDLITRATDRLQTPVSMESRGLSPGSS